MKQRSRKFERFASFYRIGTAVYDILPGDYRNICGVLVGDLRILAVFPDHVYEKEIRSSEQSCKRIGYGS